MSQIHKPHQFFEEQADIDDALTNIPNERILKLRQIALGTSSESSESQDQEQDSFFSDDQQPAWFKQDIQEINAPAVKSQEQLICSCKILNIQRPVFQNIPVMTTNGVRMAITDGKSQSVHIFDIHGNFWRSFQTTYYITGLEFYDDFIFVLHRNGIYVINLLSLLTYDLKLNFISQSSPQASSRVDDLWLICTENKVVFFSFSEMIVMKSLILQTRPDLVHAVKLSDSYIIVAGCRREMHIELHIVDLELKPLERLRFSDRGLVNCFHVNEGFLITGQVNGFVNLYELTGLLNCLRVGGIVSAVKCYKNIKQDITKLQYYKGKVLIIPKDYNILRFLNLSTGQMEAQQFKFPCCSTCLGVNSVLATQKGFVAELSW